MIFLYFRAYVLSVALALFLAACGLVRYETVENTAEGRVLVGEEPSEEGSAEGLSGSNGFGASEAGDLDCDDSEFLSIVVDGKTIVFCAAHLLVRRGFTLRSLFSLVLIAWFAGRGHGALRVEGPAHGWQG